MRELVREIKFNDDVSSVAFASDCQDLLVGHGGKLSWIASKDYINASELECTPEQLHYFYQEVTPLTEYLKKASQEQKAGVSKKLFEN
jgi:hypothetical protein